MNVSFKQFPISKNLIELSLELKNEIYYSELSVLPSFSTETIDQASKQLNAILKEIMHLSDFSQVVWTKNFFNLMQFNEVIYPSVLFALEGLLIQLLPQKNKALNYKFNDLILLDQPETYAKNLKLSEVIKIKIGRENILKETQKIRDLLNTHPEVLKVRLDANKNLSLEELHLYQNEKLEYFENPLIDPSLYQNCHYPIALDEDIEYLNTHELPNCVMALIYKPKIRLGISGTIRMIQKYPHLKHILTHSYEGEKGRKILENLPLWIAEFNQGFQGLKFNK